MRSGCLGLVVRIGIVTFAAVLAAISLALIGSFAVSAIGQPSGLSNVMRVLIACASGLGFFIVGRTVWRELRDREPHDE